MSKQHDEHERPAEAFTGVPDEQKERNAHVFLTAWRIWLEARRKKPSLASTNAERDARPR